MIVDKSNNGKNIKRSKGYEDLTSKNMFVIIIKT